MYRAAIRNNETDEIRLCPINLEWNDSVFWWTQGNMGCDCNRSRDWYRAGGMTCEVFEQLGDDNPLFKCGVNRFDVLYVELEDGTRIPIDGNHGPQEMQQWCPDWDFQCPYCYTTKPIGETTPICLGTFNGRREDEEELDAQVDPQSS